MTKSDFIALLATKLDVSKSEADNTLTAVFDTLAEVLVNQDKMLVPEFGTFSTKVREERAGRNPATGKDMVIPRAVVVNFKPATRLKEKLNSNQ